MVAGDGSEGGPLVGLSLFTLSSSVYVENFKKNHVLLFNNTKKNKKNKIFFSGCDSKISYLLGYVCS